MCEGMRKKHEANSVSNNRKLETEWILEEFLRNEKLARRKLV
jgi:hypothetical protein